MAKYLRYMGEFVSVAGVIWRAEIMQEADSAFSTIGSLDFDADQPLTIEWGNKSKEEVICGSVATLKIISPGDRTYEDLYSIEVGRIRLDVYRDNALYWSGTIDTEFYEEPYEQAQGYTVTLTFSDFGLLDRLKYDRAGMQTLASLVDYCVGRCGINVGSVNDSLISTQLTPSGSALRLSSLKVRSDNFYDEDGEASTLAEVIEGVLQPLGLRMIQRAGNVYIYDLNGLYTKAQTLPIEWDGAAQTMGVDVVYNNAKITWNTYAQSGNLSPEKCWGDIETPTNTMALNNTAGGSTGNAKYFSYHYSGNLYDWIDATDCGFTLWVSSIGNNAELLKSGVQFFKIVPQYDGTEAEGIALYWQSVAGIKVGSDNNWSANFQYKGNGTNLGGGDFSNIGSPLFKSTPVWIPPVENGGDLVLRVALDMLMDVRFNPFEQAANLIVGNKHIEGIEQKNWYDQWNTYGNFIYVPVCIKFRSVSGQVYVWDNKSIVNKAISNPVTTLSGTYGTWKDLSNEQTPEDWGYLCYYDAKDHIDTSGVLGWKKNRPAINPHSKSLISILANAEAGQYIPYPTMGSGGGEVWIEVYDTDWWIVNEGTQLSASENGPKSLWRKISWLLMKLPEIEIMNAGQFDKTISTDDVEYNAEINSAAKEPIEIDTICGTSAEGVPTARGAYFNAATGHQIKQLTRADRTTQVEDLLIGTLYSQFAQRHTTLSGEAVLPYEPMATYSEDNQGDKKFMIVADVQDARMDCSEVTYVELRPDEYEKEN